MGNVVLPATLAARLRDKLVEQDHLVKTANEQKKEAMDKLAVTQLENHVLREVMQLVADGVFEADEALQKAAEFLQSPRDLEVIKAAHQLGLDRIPTLGTPVSESRPVDKSGGNVILDALLDLQDQGLI
jgi:hypothetical protein